MPEIDPVILKVAVDADAYIQDLRKATRTVDQHFGRQERRVKQLENQFRSSSSAIAGVLKGLAGTLAIGFGGREFVNLIDRFTRFQNSLRVAGLEGATLANVQERLFQTGARYGVSVNALADLFGKAEQAGRDLGASQAELLSLTDAVAQSLLVSGASTAQASGAILGLSQALSSGIVRAEEFNQINEGGLRILLEAAAAGDRFGGSVGKLRAAVVEGEISSDSFFRSILANADLIEGRASNATLTLSGAIQSLNDSLARYVGGAANANGVTNALAEGIQALGDNLDVIIPALAVITAAIGVRLVAGFGAATASSIAFSAALAGNATQMGVVGAASFALQARLAGAATSMEALAFASRGAGASLLAAFGGPVGLAIGAVAIGLAFVATRTTEAERATQAYARGQEIGAKATEKLRIEVERLASAHGKARAEAMASARAERDLTVQKLASARGTLIQARAELNLAKARNARNLATAARTVSGAGGGPDRLAVQGVRGGASIGAAQERVSRAEGFVASIERDLAAANAALNSAPVSSGAASPTADNSRSSSRSGATGLGAELRYRDELDSIRSRIAAAEAETATTIEQRAEFERRQLELAETQALRSVENDDELDDVQKDELKKRLLALGEAERDAINFRERADIEQRNLDLAEERGRAEIDALRLQFDLADTEADRRAIALQILDAETDLLRSRLEAIVASDTANEVERERARIALEALNAQEGAQQASVNRQFEGPLARFARVTTDADTRVQEAAVRRIEQLNETIVDAMTNALGIEDPFLRDLIGIFLDRNVFGPLAEALSDTDGGTGGLGGALGSLFGSIFGRASGGPVSAGRVYRVNEGASPGRVEAFVPNTSGQIIPLGQMNAMQAGGGAAAPQRVVVSLRLSEDLDAKIVDTSSAVALEFERQVGEQRMRSTAAFTLNQAARPTL